MVPVVDVFFVWVGVLSFLYSGGLLVAQHLNMLDGELGLSLQQKGPYVLLFLTYTAAVAASATSSDLHQVFDVNDGPVCRSRISNSRAEAGAHFCGDLVAACVFMYFLSGNIRAHDRPPFRNGRRLRGRDDGRGAPTLRGEHGVQRPRRGRQGGHASARPAADELSSFLTMNRQGAGPGGPLQRERKQRIRVSSARCDLPGRSQQAP